MEKLKGDSIAILEYHSSTSDPFYNTDAGARRGYYGNPGYPNAKIDGRRTVSGGGTGTFNAYLSAYFMEIMFNPSPCSLNIFVDYNSTTRQLWVKARVTAVDPFLSSRLRYAIAESHKYHPWQGGLDSLHHIVRKMLPNYTGVAIPAMNPNDTFIDSQSYILSSAWPDTNCHVVVFVQRDDLPSKDVLRSAQSGLFPTWVFGDANGDGTMDIADVVYVINYLFLNGLLPAPPASGDANYDCIVDIADVVYMLNYLFGDGDEPLKGCAW